eukprot:TRINITY_DN1388_c0_g1_i9.p1 TRINITY_DN1388_c0_g1~~TRINITY_DN1388_c0_g1_i9.p1  ORF type:complete len:300 (-),score=54.81 TRINITY_DN1388_c0_g1_i9:120-1019(-)
MKGGLLFFIVTLFAQTKRAMRASTEGVLSQIQAQSLSNSAEAHVHKGRISVLVKGSKKEEGKREIIILVAPPAGGKGTQAERMAKKLDVAHLSTGDMLRAEVAKGSAVGLEAKDVMASGGLVSDDLVIQIAKSRISEDDCKNGFILDGFPRTVAQAKALDEMLKENGEEITKVINMEVPDDVIIKRITGRWIHEPSGRSYHVLYKPPASLKDALDGREATEADLTPDNMLDDDTDEPLTQRSDDTEEAARSRLDQYYAMTEPILGHYRETGKADRIFPIVGNQDIDKVEADINKLFDDE